MKSAEEIMQMLEAFDLTGSLRDAGELAGCSHHTVAKAVAARDAGQLTEVAAARPQLIDEFLPKRAHSVGADENIIVVHVADGGPVEVARHRRATPGSPMLDDAHFPPPPAGALGRTPKARTAADAEFLALGDGARLWLKKAAAAGTGRMRVKMAAAVATGNLVGGVDVDWALGHAAVNARFREGDLASILDHHARTTSGPTHRAGEDRSLTQVTAGWAALGKGTTAADDTDNIDIDEAGGVTA